MKHIEIDTELYRHIASHTKYIGESASDILRRLLGLSPLVDDTATNTPKAVAKAPQTKAQQTKAPQTQATKPVAEPAATSQPVAAPVASTEPSKTALESVVTKELDAQKGKVGRFLYLLSVLYQCHTNQFDNVLRIRGRNRLYFATCEKELKASGNSTNPKEVPGSGYWVITNSNTSKKKTMLKHAALELGYTKQDAEKLRDLL